MYSICYYTCDIFQSFPMLRLECSCQNSEDDLTLWKGLLPPGQFDSSQLLPTQAKYFLLFFPFSSSHLETNIGKLEKRLVTKGGRPVSSEFLSNLIIDTLVGDGKERFNETRISDDQRWMWIQVSDILRVNFPKLFFADPHRVPLDHHQSTKAPTLVKAHDPPRPKTPPKIFPLFKTICGVKSSETERNSLNTMFTEFISILDEFPWNYCLLKKFEQKYVKGHVLRTLWQVTIFSVLRLLRTSCALMFDYLLECLKIFEYVWLFIRMLEDVWRCLKMFDYL